ncbi:UDP-3-O-(3-hydroxymyristoyl)glucosamine N-acyltransferase [Henriciella aquimarina]|uniref:UDP-3-O-(3-hydroxymyristoyl)glucosamine N-acyltransferase n=1 Tax=Henriciella aquimarina TaxID=545261 RepID=UPI0009FC2E5C|nr:UDP-3-O-(3-hydroxymyristoyl)glucosamine N-acyltransferase [Henriciella aquimarina]
MSIDRRFYELLGPVSVSDLATLTGAAVHGDSTAQVTGVSAAHNARRGEVCYFDGAKPPAEGDISPTAVACFVQEKYVEALPAGVVALSVAMPRSAHTLAAGSLLRLRSWTDQPQADVQTNIHETARIAPGAYVAPGAAIGEQTVIGPNAVIGPGVQIGRDCEIGANASVQCALIGNQVKIYAGARIGESGFGVTAGPNGAEDAPQYGRVIIQDHVTVGANTCIDRGAFDDTIIGEHAKIDNLCQIGHNVVLGRSVLVASFGGISGSVTIGDGAMLGGRVGIADHVKIGAGAQIAASAGVFREIPPGDKWGGTPARPIRQWLKEVAWLQKQTGDGKRAK